MKLILRIIFLLSSGCFFLASAVFPQRQTVVVAITDFRNSTGRFVNDRLQKTVPEVLKTELAQTGAVRVIECNRLEANVNEQALG